MQQNEPQGTQTLQWQGFHHIALVTLDLDATIRFYGDVLEMKAGNVYPARGEIPVTASSNWERAKPWGYTFLRGRTPRSLRIRRPWNGSASCRGRCSISPSRCLTKPPDWPCENALGDIT